MYFAKRVPASSPNDTYTCHTVYTAAQADVRPMVPAISSQYRAEAELTGMLQRSDWCYTCAVEIVKDGMLALWEVLVRYRTTVQMQVQMQCRDQAS